MLVKAPLLEVLPFLSVKITNLLQQYNYEIAELGKTLATDYSTKINQIDDSVKALDGIICKIMDYSKELESMQSMLEAKIDTELDIAKYLTEKRWILDRDI